MRTIIQILIYFALIVKINNNVINDIYGLVTITFMAIFDLKTIFHNAFHD